MTTQQQKHRKTAKKMALPLAIALAGFGASSWGGEIGCPDKRVKVDITAQDMTQALNLLAQELGFRVMFYSDVTKNMPARPIVGEYESCDAAVKSLLAGTRLDYIVVSEKTIAIRQVDYSAGGGSREEILLAANGALPPGTLPRAETQQVNQRDGKAGAQIEEITVTATKRAANMQDIPISINAFDGDRLASSGIDDLRDLQFIAAGVQIGGTGPNTNVTIRGVGGDQLTPGSSSGVAVHLDGIYLSQKSMLNTALFDIERIEILRGPQGTLYGRNATGGSINIVSKAPNVDETAGIKMTVGNYDLIESEGYLNGAISENLTARLAGKIVKRDGYTADDFADNDLDHADSRSIRGKLRYEPTDSFTLDITADYTKDKSFPAPIVSRGFADVPTVGEIFGGTLSTGRRRNADVRERQEIEAWGVSVRSEWDLGSSVLTSLTGYRDTEYDEILDGDGTEVNAFSGGNFRQSEQFSQEFNLSSSDAETFDWIVGAFLFYEDESFDFITPVPALGFTFIGGAPDIESTAYALFAEVTYPISDRLTAIVGARYSYEEKEMEEFGGLVGALDFDELEDDWTSFTPKVSLTYAYNDDVNVYATISRGFKAGGFNATLLQGDGFGPEKVINYEVGLKSTLLDRRLRTNVSLFHMDYEDLQVQVQRVNPLTGIATTAIDNAAEATIRGLELELQAQVTDSFSFDGNVSYLDATYDDYTAVDGLRGGASFDLSGGNLQSAPEWSASLGLQFDTDIENWGSITARGEYNFQDEMSFSPFGDDLRSQGSNYRVNLHVAFESADGRWSMAVFGNNITDERAARFLFISPPTAGLLKSEYLHSPRTYGASLGYSF